MKEQGVNKTQLMLSAQLTSNQVAKIAKGEPLRMDSLVKIANVLQCKLVDIFTEDDVITD